MFKRLTYALLLFALVFAMGGQWLVLQSFAWTTMLADNLQSTSLNEALAKTFDGKHLCCLCKAVNAGRNSEQKKEFTPVTLKLEFTLLKQSDAFTSPLAFQLFPRENVFAEPLAQKPATPPPRGSFV